MDDTTSRTFQVVLRQKGRVDAALDAMAKRCTRKGLPMVSWTWGAVSTHREHHSENACAGNSGCRGCLKVSRIVLTISGPTPKFAGWTFLAALTHVEGETVVRSASKAGETSDVPPIYRTRGALCDHCNVRRDRHETYVVRHESGKTLQVGSTCLRDFLGDDSADKLAASASMIYTAFGLGEDGEEYHGGGHSDHFDLVNEFLPMVTWCVHNLGWVSRTVARERGSEATADTALMYLNNVMTASKAGARPSPEDDQLSDDAAAWAEALTDEQLAAEKSDYLHNLRVVARAGYVNRKLAGVAASMITAYERHLGRERAKAERAARPASEHVGEVGKRSLWNVTFDFMTGYDTDFGYMKVLKFRTDAGSLLVWKTTSSDLERSDVGKQYALRGTVKEHANYKGEKQTMLSRAEINVFDQAAFDAEMAEETRKSLAAKAKAGTLSPEEKTQLDALNSARKAAAKTLKAKVAAHMAFETTPFLSHYPMTHTALHVADHDEIIIYYDRDCVWVRNDASPQRHGLHGFDGATGLDKARAYVASILASS